MRFPLAVGVLLLAVLPPSLSAQITPAPAGDAIEGTWTVSNTQNPPLGAATVTITAIPDQNGRYTYDSCTGDKGSSSRGKA